MIAIVSDLHANLEATRAVMADIAEHNAEDIICLGDIIGYGPNPLECIDIAMDFKVTLQGNHEKAALVNLDGANFNTIARGAIEWTRKQLDMLDPGMRAANGRRWDFLGELDEICNDNGRTFVHGTPRFPTIEYLYEDDIRFPKKLGPIFELVDHVCFTGHTHIPGIWTEDMVFIPPVEADYRYRLTKKKTIVNVGSVGQPRDGDIRASYILLEEDRIFFRRVPYPVEETFRKIQAVPELDPALARRLTVAR